MPEFSQERVRVRNEAIQTKKSPNSSVQNSTRFRIGGGKFFVGYNPGLKVKETAISVYRHGVHELVFVVPEEFI
jgi:hypothetical protein